MWKFTNNKKSNKKDILSFVVDEQVDSAIIKDTIIYITVHYTSPSKLKPLIIISDHAKIFPNSGDEVDFSTGKAQYVVLAEDSTIKTYTVSIKRVKVKGEILSISLPNLQGNILNEKNYTIVSTSGITDFSKLAPEFVLNKGTTIEPVSGTPCDFSNGYVDYILTSIDNVKTTWRVYITGNIYTADNSYLQYTGRIDFSNAKEPKFSAPGVYISAKFKGSFVDIELKDEYLYGYRNYFQVVIDNGIPVRFRTEYNRSIYRIAKGLSDGIHTVQIIKDTESGIGSVTFTKIFVEELVVPALLPQRKIEYYGNSITCGYGIYTDLCDKAVDNEWYISNSAMYSYGVLLASRLNAQFQLTTVSGIGLINSCCGMKYNMLDAWDRIYLDKANPKWNFNNYIPDVVTICLGQNDGILDSAIFCNTYIDFIQNLKTKYPDAQIFCLTSPMADNNLLNFQKKCLNGIEKYFIAKNDTSIHKVFLSNNLNQGCLSHPNKEQHEQIAVELESVIRKVMGW